MPGDNTQHHLGPISSRQHVRRRIDMLSGVLHPCRQRQAGLLPESIPDVKSVLLYDLPCARVPSRTVFPYQTQQDEDLLVSLAPIEVERPPIAPGGLATRLLPIVIAVCVANSVRRLPYGRSECRGAQDGVGSQAAEQGLLAGVLLRCRYGCENRDIELSHVWSVLASSQWSWQCRTTNRTHLEREGRD